MGNRSLTVQKEDEKQVTILFSLQGQADQRRDSLPRSIYK